MVALVSVGMPVRNGENTIVRALDSLIAQDYPNIEILISDNISDDSTCNICASYEKKYPFVKLIRQKKFLEITDNFGAVLKAANGDFFMWAAADDFWEPAFVSSLVSKISKDEKMAVAQTATLKVAEDGKTPLGCISFRGKRNPENHSMLQMTSRLVSLDKYNFYIYGLFRRTILMNMFFYWPRVTSSDRWFLLQVPLGGYRMGYVDEPLYVRTISSKPFYDRYNKNEQLASLLRAIEHKWFRFDALPAVRNMIKESSVISRKGKRVMHIVLFQLLVSRVHLALLLIIKDVERLLLPDIILAKLAKRRRARALNFSKDN